MTPSSFKSNSQRRAGVLLALPLLIAALLSGCASSKGVAVIGGSALGSIIAHEASDGDAAWTAGGAAIGALAGMGSNALADQTERKAYRNGYQAAINQSVKQQYWIIQNRQKEDAFINQPEGESFVPIEIPEQTINGEIRKARIIYVRAK